MKRFISTKRNINTIKVKVLIVFFLIILNTFLLYNFYAKNVKDSIIVLINEKLDKVIYQFFTDLITDEVINIDTVNNLMEITKNSNDEIISVNYDLEKTYKILTDVSKILKDGLIDLENGNIDVLIYDKYLENSNNGLRLNVPLFLGSANVFLNNLGPSIPVLINFNGALLTNIKTKVTDYGFNNALLEIFITVEIDKTIITPVTENKEKFYYDILVGALVINGSVPEFYSSYYESSSSIVNIPIKA